MEEKREEVEEKKTYQFGWLQDYPDFRDYTEEVEAIKPLLEKTSVTGRGTLPNPSVDLKMWFSPIEDQGNIGSCTANAAVGVVEYYERSKLLAKIKAYLASGLPSMFGFTVYDSIRQASRDGEIPFPCPRERTRGGHAVVAVGYDDEKKIKNVDCGTETKGALRIRNSWSEGWGDGGYGWLPYEYALKALTRDFWVLLRLEWVDTGKFR